MDGDTVAIGRISITALADRDPGVGIAALNEVFPTVPEAAWESFVARLPQCFPAPGDWAIGLNAWLVRTPNLTVLVDTGEGLTADIGTGLLPASLAAHGIGPDDVDLVFLTHLDIDHVGWTLTREGTPTFPRARYVVTRAEWEYVQRPGARARYERSGAYLDAAVYPLGRLGVLDLVEGEAALADGLSVIPAPGHTPGHAGLLVNSEGQQALLLGDAVHHPAQVTESGWASRYDDDPGAAATTRARFAEWAAREGMIVAATHFPAPGFGRIVSHQGRRRWEPL